VAVPLLATVIAELWIVGALRENWDGHVAFGMRYLTSTWSVVGVGLAIGLMHAPRAARRVTLALGTACAVFTLAFGIQYRLDLLPKRDRLTVAELLTDKVQLSRARRRHRAAAAANTLITEGRFAGAAAQVSLAERSFGPSRELLETDVNAHRRLGDAAGEAAARVALARFLDSRLF
jgi:hypothetical protein